MKQPTETMRKCTCCNLEFPKTEEYFYRRNMKQKLASGKIKIYNVFMPFCKKCCVKDVKERRIKKRCKELNCDVSDYIENLEKQKSENRILAKKIAHLPRGTRGEIRKKVKKGYVFTNYEQYRIDCRKNISKAARKYEYGDIDFVPKREGLRTGIKHLTDGYIALALNAKVKEVPKEVIETKRLIIQLKRELKSNNVKIR